MRKIAIATLVICLVFSTAVLAAEPSPYENAIVSLFRHAIVKIDVSTTTPVFVENEKKESVNICRSEGTGFLVNTNHVVTAEHVYLLAPECGQPSIVVKSKRSNLQKLAEVVAAKDDVALLKVDSDFPAEMCALGLVDEDVYDTVAIRFGIPGGWDQPGPPAGVRIDQKDGQFSPLTLLNPAITEKGESGGPIIYLFNVVGLTRARHLQYIGYSFMTAASAISSLMAANGVRPSANICNPVRVKMRTNYDSAPFSSSVFDDLLSGFFGRFSIAGPTGELVASITVNDQLAAQISSIVPDVLKSKTFDDPALTIRPISDGTEISIQGKFQSAEDRRGVEEKAARTTGNISQKLRETLWRRYVFEARQAGMWKDAVSPLRAPAQ
jgi:hypothetical protein